MKKEPEAAKPTRVGVKYVKTEQPEPKRIYVKYVKAEDVQMPSVPRHHSALKTRREKLAMVGRFLGEDDELFLQLQSLTVQLETAEAAWEMHYNRCLTLRKPTAAERRQAEAVTSDSLIAYRAAKYLGVSTNAFSGWVYRYAIPSTMNDAGKPVYRKADS